MRLETLFERNIGFAESAGLEARPAHAPELVTVSCCDARVPQGRLFGTECGETFTVANIGNRVWKQLDSGEKALRGSVVYPLAHTDAAIFVVIGHTGCGAITATYRWLQGELSDPHPSVRDSLEQLREPVARGLDALANEKLSEDQLLAALAEYNVDAQVEHLRDKDFDVDVVGVMCDIHDLYAGETGQCHLVNMDGQTDGSNLPDNLQRFFYRISSR